MVMLMANQDPLAGAPHAMLIVVFFQTLQASEHRGVLLRLCFLGAECVVGERVEADSLRLFGGEVLGDDWSGHCGLLEKRERLAEEEVSWGIGVGGVEEGGMDGTGTKRDARLTACMHYGDGGC
jgi:hypothetical protein